MSWSNDVAVYRDGLTEAIAGLRSLDVGGPAAYKTQSQRSHFIWSEFRARWARCGARANSNSR